MKGVSFDILRGEIFSLLGIYAAGIVQMAILIGLGALLFGVAWGQSPLALALVVLRRFQENKYPVGHMG